MTNLMATAIAIAMALAIATAKTLAKAHPMAHGMANGWQTEDGRRKTCSYYVATPGPPGPPIENEFSMYDSLVAKPQPPNQLEFVT